MSFQLKQQINSYFCELNEGEQQVAIVPIPQLVNRYFITKKMVTTTSLI